MIDDLQTLLITYERAFPHLVRRFSELVSREYIITATCLEAETQKDPPVLIFENVEGTAWPIVTGLFSNRERIAWALGTNANGLHRKWIEWSSKLIPPVVVGAGFSQEIILEGNDVNVTRLPILKHFKQDAGNYITSGIFVAKDPDTGVGNLSYARMQLKASNKFGISMHSRGHMWDYFRRAELKGKSLEVAVIIGAHPALMIGAASKTAINVDEYDIAGALLGHPVELVHARTVDILVPASAEIILEGIIEAGEREPEGPFGEYTGYASGRSTQNVLTIKAITHRSHPIYLDTTPGYTLDHLNLSGIQREAENLRLIQSLMPNVRSIFYPSSGTHFHCYLSIQKLRPGDARQAGVILLGLDPYVKMVVVVDDDIEISRQDEVLWAMATRMQPQEDMFIIQNLNCNVLDPSSREGLSSKVVIDATMPKDWDIERCTVPEEAIAAARRMLGTI